MGTTVIFKSGAQTQVPHVNRADAERTMVEIINSMAAGNPLIVIEDEQTSAMFVTSEVAGITLGAPPVAVQIERPKPRPVPLPQPAARPERGTMVGN